MVWIISPDPGTRRLVGLNLSKRGFHTLEISSRDAPACSGTQPHLIILDIMDPPDESGWEVAGALRQNLGAESVPLILLLSAAPTLSQLATLQPVRWVEKPLAIDALLAVILESLGQQPET